MRIIQTRSVTKKARMIAAATIDLTQDEEQPPTLIDLSEDEDTQTTLIDLSEDEDMPPTSANLSGCDGDLSEYAAHIPANMGWTNLSPWDLSGCDSDEDENVAPTSDILNEDEESIGDSTEDGPYITEEEWEEEDMPLEEEEDDIPLAEICTFPFAVVCDEPPLPGPESK